jgi:hypothetical protein
VAGAPHKDQISFSAGPPEVELWQNIPAAAGVAPAGPFLVTFTVGGRTDAEIALTGVDVHVTDRKPAPAGILLDDPCGDDR